CATEASISEEKEEAEWIAKENGSIVFSQPACLDENMNLITRVCLNGTWIPPHIPKCSKIIKNFCPVYESFCFFISTTEQIDEKQKTYMNGHSLVRIPKFIKDVVLFKRSQPFGPYEPLALDIHNANISNISYPMNMTEPGKDCAVIDVETTDVRQEYCNNNYSQCWYTRRMTLLICALMDVSAPASVPKGVDTPVESKTYGNYQVVFDSSKRPENGNVSS
ncbi:unnamed protein product, partial [Acanthoscelides obtectus]